MRYLLDTHLLIWAVTEDKKLSASAAALIEDMENTLIFSVLSLWEIALKRGFNRKDFLYDANFVRQSLINNGYEELPILSQHVAAVETLPPIHKDPFDRLLLAQASAEGLVLLTTDALVAQYPGPVRLA